ncbi:Tat pathway signal protein [Polymorphobacter multimanifer]|uniref:DUF885 domain-containing protein n=1 Tax=Polymorphobacter multimanifer TaxID=1070431 RepID=UPI001662AFE3|nr:DUF885 family protein [Polymorphobacter multimanifer]GGI91148.1 Tat pathway signal protein [Polymorphobacter multimanifer]
MQRRTFLASTGALALAPTIGIAQTAGAADAALRTLLDDIFYQRVEANPTQATSLGLDTGPRAALRSQLGDESLGARTADLARDKAALARLRTIDRAALSPEAQVDHEVVEYQLVRGITGAERFTYGSAGGRYAPYVLTQLTGPYREVPDFLDSQHRIRPGASAAADADAYIARLRAFPETIDDSSEAQAADAARGVFAPDFILDTTLKVMGSLRDQPPEATVPVRAFATKLAAANLPADRVAEATAIMRDEVFPALDRQRALVTRLRANATHDAGAWRLPDGEAYYTAAAQAATTTTLSGDDIHKLGLAQVAEISARLDPLLRAQGLTQGTVGARLVALNERPDQLFPNTDPGREALLAQLNAQIRAIQPRLSEQFATLPQAPVEVRRVPESIQAGAPGGYYQSATLDGSRPGIYFINLRDTFDRPKFGLATLTRHEAVPGHHLQVMLALESTAIPLIRRRASFSAYTEGWALYSEQLADEMGMYEGDPLGQIGFLQSLLFRATRLVVDSGLHAKRWSREKATDELIATTGIARGRSQGEIDRYCVWPGQACSYKIGHTVWARLRDAVKAKQGAAFDPKAFHSVLLQGPLPLTVLERLVERRFLA